MMHVVDRSFVYSLWAGGRIGTALIIGVYQEANSVVLPSYLVGYCSSRNTDPYYIVYSIFPGCQGNIAHFSSQNQKNSTFFSP